MRKYLSFFTLSLLFCYILPAQDRDSLWQVLFRRYERLAHSAKAVNVSGSRSSNRNLSDYYPGQIPISEGVSLSGARTYTVPIQTAPGFQFVPQLAVSYNSQAGNGYYPSSGCFSFSVNLYGYDIWIRGVMVDGIPKVGTMFIP